MKIIVRTKEGLNRKLHISYNTEILQELQSELVRQEIRKQCMGCKRHGAIKFEDKVYHTCYDDWSGEYKVGLHVIDSKTLELCKEIN